MNPYNELANAIVLKAVEDYRKTSRAYDRLCGGGKKLTPSQQKNKVLMEKMLSDCERFFKSQWFGVLTSVDGKDLLKKLEKERYKKTRFFDFLRGEMKRQKITQQAAADFLGITQGMFSRKIKDGSFTIRELKELRILLDIPSETIARFI